MVQEILTRDVIKVDLEGDDKPSVIRSLLTILCRTGKVRDPGLALSDLLRHEADISTGMEHGIAIPHAKTSAVDEFVAGVGVSRRKINFESLDRQPSRIFVMTLSPSNGSEPHISFLKDMARLLADAKVRRRILEARSDAALFEILTAAE